MWDRPANRVLRKKGTTSERARTKVHTNFGGSRSTRALKAPQYRSNHVLKINNHQNSTTQNRKIWEVLPSQRTTFHLYSAFLPSRFSYSMWLVMWVAWYSQPLEDIIVDYAFANGSIYEVANSSRVTLPSVSYVSMFKIDGTVELNARSCKDPKQSQRAQVAGSSLQQHYPMA